MKKLILGVALMAAMSFSVSVSAQDAKTKKECPKTETCCKKEKKACDQKKDGKCCKSQEKKCCSEGAKKECPKKAADKK